MQGYSRVKVGFGQPGLDRNSHRLKDFWRFGADHVDAQHFVGRRVDHQLVKSALGALAENVFHRTEVGAEDLDVAVDQPRLFLGQPDRGNRRL